jgi:hypothetical protein
VAIKRPYGAGSLGGELKLFGWSASHWGAYSTTGKTLSRRLAAASTRRSVLEKSVGMPPTSVNCERWPVGTSAKLA